MKYFALTWLMVIGYFAYVELFKFDAHDRLSDEELKEVFASDKNSKSREELKKSFENIMDYEQGKPVQAQREFRSVATASENNYIAENPVEDLEKLYREDPGSALEFVRETSFNENVDSSLRMHMLDEFLNRHSNMAEVADVTKDIIDNTKNSLMFAKALQIHATLVPREQFLGQIDTLIDSTDSEEHRTMLKEFKKSYMNEAHN